MNEVRTIPKRRNFKKQLAQFGVIFSLALIFSRLILMLGFPALILLVLFGLFIIILIKLEFGLYLLIIASVFNRYSVEYAGLTMRPDQLMAVLVVLGLSLQVFIRRKQLHRSPLDLPIICYVLINVLASLINSPYFYLRQSLQRCALILVASLCYFAIFNFIDAEEILKKSLKVFLAIGVLEVAYGVSAVLLLGLTGINIGIQRGYPFLGGVPYGTLLEANIFGSFSMAIGLILLTYYLSDYYHRWRRLIGLSFVLVMIGLILSYTRAAWLGFLLGLAFLPFLMRERLFLKSFKMVVAVSAAVVLFAILSSIAVFNRIFRTGAYIDRFSNIINLETPAARMRLIGFRVAISEWKGHPFIGNGTDTMKLNPQVGWIPNIFIITLHDTGVVGLAILLWMLGAFLLICLFTLRRMKNGFYKTNLIAFLVSFIGLMMAYQATSAHWLGFMWIHMGLTMAIIRMSLQEAAHFEK